MMDVEDRDETTLAMKHDTITLDTRGWGVVEELVVRGGST